MARRAHRRGYDRAISACAVGGSLCATVAISGIRFAATRLISEELGAETPGRHAPARCCAAWPTRCSSAWRRGWCCGWQAGWAFSASATRGLSARCAFRRSGCRASRCAPRFPATSRPAGGSGSRRSSISPSSLQASRWSRIFCARCPTARSSRAAPP